MGFFNRKSSSRTASITSDSKSSFRKGSTTSLASSSLKSPTLPRMSSSLTIGIPGYVLPPAPDPAIDPAAYLRSIYAVRERTRFVIEAAMRNQLTNFVVDMSKLQDVVDYVTMIIKVGLPLPLHDRH